MKNKKGKGILILVLVLLVMAASAFVAGIGIGKTNSGAAKNIKLGLDLAGGVSITYQAKDANPSAEDMADTVYKLQQRAQGYSAEAQVYQEGDNRITIEIPGVSDAETILEDLGSPGSLIFVDTSGKEVLEGTDIADAQAGSQTNQQTNALEYVVQLKMTKEGAQKFEEATSANVGKQIAIIYDDQVVSSPRVKSAISGGEAIIDGMASMEEAENLASFIRIGSLSLELEELRSQVVGAQLGTKAISTSLIAGAIGLAIVAVFMIVVYLLPGLAAALALLLYTLFTLLILNAFDITLTLPGIAGVILAIGMAVDANVIIIARIKEELADGRDVKTATKIGFSKALPAIIDGNVTTLIVAVILMWLGSGSVRGFGQTLAIGIVLSMFTALVVSRLIMNAFIYIGLTNVKLYGKQKERKPINFVGKKAICFAISLIVIVIGLAGMAIHAAKGNMALNYSLDFLGGTSTNVTLNEDMSIEEIDEKVVPVVEEVSKDVNTQVQKVAGSNEIIIKTIELDQDQRAELSDALVENFKVDEDLISYESISSTVSNEMRSDAIVAVIVSIIIMLIYIWFRFSDIRFALSSVLALAHDVLVVIGFYAILRISVGSTFIACLLTIVGYSINATIVVFDRVRENLKKLGKSDLSVVVNTSITQTLTRSIYTSFTTFVMVLVLYILGVSSVREFALPLMAGIVCGAYSSVCIAGNLWYVMRTKFGKKNK